MPKRVQSKLLHFASKKSRPDRKSEGNRRSQPNRSVHDADEADDQNHGVTLRKTNRACQEGNKESEAWGVEREPRCGATTGLPITHHAPRSTLHASRFTLHASRT